MKISTIKNFITAFLGIFNIAKRPVSWLTLLLGLSMITNGTFFFRNKELRAQAENTLVMIDPEKTDDIVILQSELITSRMELQKCITDLMAN